MPALRSVRLLDRVREGIRYLNYSIRTEEANVHWIKAFIFFHGRRHPGELSGPEVDAFLSCQANERNVAVSTHQQAGQRVSRSYSSMHQQTVSLASDHRRLYHVFVE